MTPDTTINVVLTNVKLVQSLVSVIPEFLKEFAEQT